MHSLHTASLVDGYKSKAFKQFLDILRQCNSRDHEATLVIVPSRAYKHWLLCQISDTDDCQLSPRILTLDQIAIQCCDRPVSSALCDDQLQLLAQCQAVTAPDWYPSLRQKPGFRHHLLAWYQQILRHHPTLRFPDSFEELETQLASASEHKTLHQLTLFAKHKASKSSLSLLEAYRYMDKNRLETLFDLSEKALFLSGFWEIQAYQHQLLSHCIKSSASCSIFTFYDEGQSDLCGAHAMQAWLQQTSPKLTTLTTALPSAFVQDARDVQARTANSVEEEVSACTQYLASCSEEERRETAIVCANKAPYQTLFERKLHRLGLRLAKPGISYLKHHPTGIWIRDWLQWLTQPYDIDRIENVLSNPLMAGGRPDLWRRASQRFGRQHSQKGWQAAFEQLAKSEANRESRDQDPLHQPSNHRIKALENQINILASITTLHHSLKQKPPLANALRDIVSTAAQFAIPQWQSPLKAHVQEAVVLKDPYLNTAAQKTLGNICHLLTCYINNTRIENEESDGDIQLLETFENVLYPYQTVIFLGATQENWPKLPEKNMFATPAAKAFCQIPTTQEHVDAERYALLARAHLAKQRIIISTPTTPAQPSIHITAMERALNQKAMWQPWPRDPDPAPSHPAPVVPQPFFKSQETATQIRQQLQSRPLSASKLEAYQRCPYKFYLERILREPEDTWDSDDIPPTQWGALIHQILHEFFEAVSQQQLSLSKEADRKPLYRLIDTIGNACFKRYKTSSFLWKIKEKLLFGSEEQSGLLHLFIDAQCTHPLPLEIDALEIAFGQNNDVLIRNNGNKHRPMTGKIDVLLTAKDKGLFAVLDYKTGTMLSTPKDIEQLRSLQLPLYLLAGKQIRPQLSPAAAILVQIKDLHHIQTHIVCISESAKKELFNMKRKRPFVFDSQFFDTLSQHVLSLDTQMGNGQFSPECHDRLPNMKAQRKQLCSHCHYRHCCTYTGRFESARQ